MKKIKISKKLLFPILFSTLYFILSNNVFAAQVYFEPQPATYKVGDSFTLSLFLDTEGQSINAIELNIVAPQLLRIKNISKNSSAIQLWVQEPGFSGETINLTGGIPGGLKTSNGLIAKISFQAAAVGEGNIAFSTGSSVLLNDGQGTKLDLKTSGGPVFKVIPRPKEILTNTPEPGKSAKENEKPPGKQDQKRPDKFKILSGSDPRVFDGKDFISFFTVDSGSGIDRYEIKLGEGDFRVAQAPYLLEGLAPRTVIKVRAYDSSGNYREVVYPGILKRFWWWIIELIR